MLLKQQALSEQGASGRSQICRVSHLSVALRLRRMRGTVESQPRGRIVISEKFHVRSIGRERKQARVGREVASLPESRLARTHTRQPQRAATGRSGSVGQIFSFIRLDGQGLVARLNSILDGASSHVVAHSYNGLVN